MAKETAEARVLKLLEDEEALVKSVGDRHWASFSTILMTGTKTPTTLLPAGGKAMDLYGSTQRACCGMIWDLNKVIKRHKTCGQDTSTYYAWPSGYYAKTEFNMMLDGSLKNGRKDHLVSLDTLRLQNRQILQQRAQEQQGQRSSSLAAYNEVLTQVTHDSVVGLFCRTMHPPDIVFLISLAETLQAQHARAAFPLLYLDPTDGARAITHREQQECIRWCLERGLRGPEQHAERQRIAAEPTISPSNNALTAKQSMKHGRWSRVARFLGAYPRGR